MQIFGLVLGFVFGNGFSTGGQVYRRMPHQGYLRNGVLYRNSDRRAGVY